jgi:hypothetical protein
MKRQHSGRGRVDNKPGGVRGRSIMSGLPSHATPGPRNLIAEMAGPKVARRTIPWRGPAWR